MRKVKITQEITEVHLTRSEVNDIISEYLMKKEKIRFTENIVVNFNFDTLDEEVDGATIYFTRKPQKQKLKVRSIELIKNAPNC